MEDEKDGSISPAKAAAPPPPPPKEATTTTTKWSFRNNQRNNKNAPPRCFAPPTIIFSENEEGVLDFGKVDWGDLDLKSHRRRRHFTPFIAMNRHHRNGNDNEDDDEHRYEVLRQQELRRMDIYPNGVEDYLMDPEDVKPSSLSLIVGILLSTNAWHWIVKPEPHLSLVMVVECERYCVKLTRDNLANTRKSEAS